MWKRNTIGPEMNINSSTSERCQKTGVDRPDLKRCVGWDLRGDGGRYCRAAHLSKACVRSKTSLATRIGTLEDGVK